MITLLEEVKKKCIVWWSFFLTRQFHFYPQNNKEMSNFVECSKSMLKISWLTTVKRVGSSQLHILSPFNQPLCEKKNRRL